MRARIHKIGLSQIGTVFLRQCFPEVEDIKEIRGITIKGVQKKKKNVRVTYTVVS